MNGPLYRRLDEHPRTPVHAALSRDRQRERERVSERYHISPLLFIFTLGALALCFYLSFVGAAGEVDAENGVQGTTKNSKKWGQINRTTNGTPTVVLFSFSVLMNVNASFPSRRTHGNNCALC